MPTGPAEEVVVPFRPRLTDKPPNFDHAPPADQPVTKLPQVDKEGAWGSPVAMLQQIIDDIETGKRQPEDIFVGIYEENQEAGTFKFSMLRYNLTGLELLGRMWYFLRDLGF